MCSHHTYLPIEHISRYPTVVDYSISTLINLQKTQKRFVVIDPANVVNIDASLTKIKKEIKKKREGSHSKDQRFIRIHVRNAKWLIILLPMQY